ncbi:hypothetical protein [Nocardia asteroides]|uniref:hypothetical protein n=1 Tax=Nocardia asteroides TaxID=1824 RepID=UPI003449CB9F
MLKADIDQIRALSVKLTNAGESIDALDVRSGASSLDASLPDGTNDATFLIPEAAAQAALAVEGAFLRAAERYKQVATLCTTCADNLQMTDEEFGSKLSELDIHSA